MSASTLSVIVNESSGSIFCFIHFNAPRLNQLLTSFETSASLPLVHHSSNAPLQHSDGYSPKGYIVLSFYLGDKVINFTFHLCTEKLRIMMMLDAERQILTVTDGLTGSWTCPVFHY